MFNKKKLANSILKVDLNSDAIAVIMEAFNIGRWLQASKVSDEIDRIQSSSLLDKETCTYCAAWDGKEWSSDSPEAPPEAPPYKQCGEGYGKCRCVWVYIFKSESRSKY